MYHIILQVCIIISYIFFTLLYTSGERHYIKHILSLYKRCSVFFITLYIQEIHVILLYTMRSYLTIPIEYRNKALIFTHDIFGADTYLSCRKDIEENGYYMTCSDLFGGYNISFKEGYYSCLEELEEYITVYA